EARRLLQAAIDGGAPLEDALPILERLHRLDPLPAISPAARSAADRHAHTTADATRRAGRTFGFAVALTTLLAIVAVGAYAAAASDTGWRPWLSLPNARSTAATAPAARDVILAIPQR